MMIVQAIGETTTMAEKQNLDEADSPSGIRDDWWRWGSSMLLFPNALKSIGEAWKVLTICFEE